jgi:hypothetical protein
MHYAVSLGATLQEARDSWQNRACYSVGTGKHVKSEQQDCSAGLYEWGACMYYSSRRNTDRWTDRVDTIGHQYVLPEETDRQIQWIQ